MSTHCQMDIITPWSLCFSLNMYPTIWVTNLGSEVKKFEAKSIFVIASYHILEVILIISLWDVGDLELYYLWGSSY